MNAQYDAIKRPSHHRNPMHILHIIASFNPVIGGPAEAIRNIVTEYNKVGITAEIVCLDAPDAPFLANESTLSIHALGHLDPLWFFSLALTQWLTTNVSRFDTIIVHGLWLYPSFAVNAFVQKMKAEAPRTGKKPPLLLIFPHGMLDPYFQRASQRRFKAIRNWLYWKVIERRVVNEADALLFTCQTELLLAQRTFRPYHPKQAINVGYGIADPPAYTPDMATAFAERCPAVAGRPYLLFLSRIHYKKGVDLLIEAYARLVATHNDRLADVPLLVIAGPGLDTPYGATIQQLMQRYPTVQQRIIFPGMLTGKVKWGSLYGCQAFVLPSHQENFGIAVAEALACSKPVLISNQINIWREVQQGEGGLVADDTAEGTASLLGQWVGLTRKAQLAMAINARHTFESYFRMKQVIQRLNHLFATFS